MTAHPTNPDFTTAGFERHVIRPDVHGNLADRCGRCTLLPTVTGFVRAKQAACPVHGSPTHSTNPNTTPGEATTHPKRPDPRGLTVTRSLRHRIARRRLSPYVWGCVPVVSPYLDRLRAAAFDPCWRTSPEGREHVAALERSMDWPAPTNPTT